MAQSLTSEQITVQKQTTTQQTIRLMQLVELPYTSLEQEILREVDENPALEAYHEEDDYAPKVEEETEPDEFDENGAPRDLTDEMSREEISNDTLPTGDDDGGDDYDGYASERDIERQIQRINAPAEDPELSRQDVYYLSQQEQWQSQLGTMEMTDQQRLIANYLVGDLDGRGYLSSDLQAIVNELLYTQNVYTNVAEVEEILTKYIQELDPVGTGARNMQECLLLQLKRDAENENDNTNAILVLEQCFDLLSNKKYDKIMSKLDISEEQLRAALTIIKNLNPYPVDTSSPMDSAAAIIHPDFIISSKDGKLELSLNNQFVPKVRLNKEFCGEYCYMSKEEAGKKKKEADRFMKEYVDKANQFIGTLTTREQILFNTMYAIMQHQKEYFLTGEDTALKPMVLKTIAQEVKLDISTISRVSNSKYVQTDFGVIQLKHLFSESVNDNDVSSKAIKSELSDIINNEDKSKPLSDDKMCQMLSERGYNIARRTVAKYREQLGIPVARLRKEIS